MAVLPNYTAGAPPTVRGPVLEQQQAPRVNAGQGLQSLNRLAQTVAGSGVRMPGAPESLGQGRARGLMALGDGVAKLGEVFQALDRERAEARNVAAVHEATLEMDRIAGDFAVWREQNPDPSRWEEELENRLGGFTAYTEGRDLSPVAQEEISRRFEQFATRAQIDTRVSAVKAEVARAREAGEAQWIRAVDAGDAETATAIARDMAERGWIAEDTAARMEIEAVRGSQAKAKRAAIDASNAFLNYGDLEGAREAIDGARWAFETEEEFAFVKSELDTKHAVQLSIQEIGDRAADEPGGPLAIAKEMEQRNEDGTPAAYPELRGATRQKVLSDLYASYYAEREAVMKQTHEGIKNGAIRTMEDVERFAGEFELSGIERAAYEKALQGEFLKDEAYVQNAITRAADYDPENDVGGVKYGSIRTEISAVMGDDPRVEGILTVLEKKRNGDPLTLGERTRAAVLKRAADFDEAAGDWKIPAKRLTIVPLPEGGEVIVDTMADVKPGDPDYFEKKGKWGWGGIKGRRVELSQEDRLAVADEKRRETAIVEDITRRNAAFLKTNRAADEIVRQIEAGKIRTEEEATEAWLKTVAPNRLKAAEKIVEQIFETPEMTPEQEASWLDSYSIPF